jgi:hypothetical protein
MRRAGQVLLVISTLICVLFCVAWVRSIGWSESIQHITQYDTTAGTSVRLIRIMHANGVIFITRTSGDERVRLAPLPDRGWTFMRASAEPNFLREGDTLPKRLGFQYYHRIPNCAGGAWDPDNLRWLPPPGDRTAQRDSAGVVADPVSPPATSEPRRALSGLWV